MKILDMGCGKGFVTISLAREFKCPCHGIDAMPVFIYEAEQKAIEYSVSDFSLLKLMYCKNSIQAKKIYLKNI